MEKAKYNSVMLIDDNEIDNFSNQKLIEGAKFAKEIHVMNSGKNGLEKLKSMPKDKLPEVIFLDIMMPIMDGFQFLEQFEKLDASIHEKCKIVMLSTSESFKDLNRANKNPFVFKFLNKPLSEPMLNAIQV